MSKFELVEYVMQHDTDEQFDDHVNRIEFLVNFSSQLVLLPCTCSNYTHKMLSYSLDSIPDSTNKVLVNVRKNASQVFLKQEILKQICADALFDSSLPISELVTLLMGKEPSQLVIAINNLHYVDDQFAQELACLIQSSSEELGGHQINVLLAGDPVWADRLNKWTQSHGHKAPICLSLDVDESGDNLESPTDINEPDEIINDISVEEYLEQHRANHSVKRKTLSWSPAISSTFKYATMFVFVFMLGSFGLWQQFDLDKASLDGFLSFLQTSKDDKTSEVQQRLLASKVEHPQSTEQTESASYTDTAALVDETKGDSESITETASVDKAMALEPTVEDIVTDNEAQRDGTLDEMYRARLQLLERQKQAEINGFAMDAMITTARVAALEQELAGQTKTDEQILESVASPDEPVAATVATDIEQTLTPTNNRMMAFDHESLLKDNESAFTFQLTGVSSVDVLESFVEDLKEEHPILVYQTVRQNSPWFVVVMGRYKDLRQAQLAQQNLPQSIAKLNPFLKSFSVIKTEIQKGEQQLVVSQ